MFKPIVHACEIEDGGETFKFWVREASGREILTSAANAKKNQDRPPIENARDLFAKYMVHEDSSVLTNPEVEELLDMRISAMQQVSEIVQEKIGLKKIAEKNA